MTDGLKPAPAVEQMVREMIDAVADRWTMFVLETLEEHGELRFTRLADLIGGVSQKMLTKTLRQMERDGLVVRTVHPVIPPHVEYRLTDMGLSLSEAFCGVWQWVEAHQERVRLAREEFDARPKVVVEAK
jgi:DNA-binding HxlR family transcriptional regulator